MKTYYIRYLPSTYQGPNEVRQVIIVASSEKEALKQITEPYSGHMVYELESE